MLNRVQAKLKSMGIPGDWDDDDEGEETCSRLTYTSEIQKIKQSVVIGEEKDGRCAWER